MSAEYWSGFATPFAVAGIIALAWFTVWGAIHRWKYLSKSCGVKGCQTTWVATEHPNRPWWLWEVRVRLHGKRDPAHREHVRRWHADHCERRWYGPWRYVR